MTPTIRTLLTSFLIAAVAPVGMAVLDLETPAFAKNNGGNGGSHGGVMVIVVTMAIAATMAMAAKAMPRMPTRPTASPTPTTLLTTMAWRPTNWAS